MLRASHIHSISSSSLNRVLLDRLFTSILHYDQKTPISAIISLPISTIYPPSRRSHPSNFTTVHDVFDEMPKREFFSANTRFSHIIDALRSSMKRSDVRIVMGLHCLGLKLGVFAHLPTSTILLTLYSRAEDLASSLALFREMHRKDVVFRNAMLTALIQSHRFELVLDFSGDMIKNRDQFDSTTLLLVVSASSHTNSLNQGKMVHGMGIKSGMISVSSLCNALVNMYAKCGDLNSAEYMFGCVERRDSVSWNSMITGCLANDRPRKSILYFKQMACADAAADDVSLSCAVSASSSLEEFGLGELLHGMVIKSGHVTSISVANSLISMYARSGDVEAAETVFGETVHKDIVSWNAMIDGFASNGMIDEAFDLLSDMQVIGSAHADDGTIVPLISLCTESMSLREGRSIHGYAVRRLMGSDDMSVANSLLDMYAKCNEIHTANCLFRTMPEQDLISWNTMISGCTHNGLCEEAQVLFKEMLCSCSNSSVSTLLAILSSCYSSEFLAFGKSIHCSTIKLGFENNVLVMNSLMNMYLNCESLAEAFFLLQKMSLTRDTTSWNTVIYGCTAQGHYLKALELFKSLRGDLNASHDSITLLGVISACGNLGWLLQGKSLHCFALKTLPVLDVQIQNALLTMYGRCEDMTSTVKVFDLIPERNLCSCNCMISAFSQNKMGREALELFWIMEFRPDEITFVSLLPACTQLGFISNGIQIHCYTIRHGFDESPFVSAALMGMYSNLGRVDVALKIFQLSKESRSIVTWNAMISSYGCHGQGIESIRLFYEMCRNGIQPNGSTFTSLLSACSHSGLVEAGIWYYRHMLGTYGVEPVTEHQVCYVDMLGRSGRLQEAYKFIRECPKMPEPGVWGAMLSACNYHGNMEIGRKVAELLFKLEPENAGYYVSLSNMYVAAGRWKEATEVRERAQGKRLKKPPGYSLLDVGFA